MPSPLSSQVLLGSIRSGAVAVDTEGHLPRSYEPDGYYDLIEAVAAGPIVGGGGEPR